MDENVKAMIKDNPELAAAFEEQRQIGINEGMEAARNDEQPKTKIEKLRKKAPAKKKCFGKYPKNVEGINKNECRGCFWAQVCKKKVKADDHLLKMLG